ncbi:MAG TPA: hypothetical protein PLT00_15615 [Verrucomicrobiota bacterium]|nr:hypothetical protein [Verrucomicrobiota bacterium]OQB91281.1 MAG: hypothetical protein BWX84_01466 [Verrucomicrobia bacterium ADurb.Bin118]HPY31950.1 hypothetical protein [Verrucomicrobiota bacterium]HQB18125.1 hypothetical protein [Verrucomicrobiota bacterium]
MQPSRQKTSRNLPCWLFPRKDNLHAKARLFFGFFGNVALLVYVLPRKDHLFDIRDYRYVPLDLTMVFLLAAIPLIVVIGVLPALLSERLVYRWLGIVLSIFPAFLAIAEWLQLLTL